MFEEVTGLGQVISAMLEQYGVTGLGFTGLLLILYKNKNAADKRISELEKQVEENTTNQIANYREMIGEYVELVKSNGEVLVKLTSCLDSMNATLHRMDRKPE